MRCCLCVIFDCLFLRTHAVVVHLIQRTDPAVRHSEPGMCRSIHRHNNLIPFSKKHLIYIKLKVLYRTLQTKYASSISSGFSAVST